MILHSVRVENYKGIRGPVEVAFDPDSMNLLEGANGVGKSTLLDAVQCCLVESYNTAGAGAEEMRPRETASTPAISVVFGHAGGVYRISKTFLDSPKSQLEKRRMDGEFEAIAKGKTADEQVRAMLRSQASRAKEPGERLGLFSVLCSTQGKQALPALSGDALADIRAMLGAQVSGTRGAAFERVVGKKYLSVWTPGGKPRKGKLTETQTALAAARQDSEKYAAIMLQVSDLEVSARNQRAVHQETTDRLRSAQGEHGSLAAVAQQLIDLRARRAPALGRLETANAKYEQARAEMDRIVEAGRKRRAGEEARPKLEEAEAGARLARDTRVKEALDAQSGWDAVCGTNAELEQLEQRMERAAAFLESGRELDALESRLRYAATADGRSTEVESGMAALNAPDPGAWSKIQTAGREFDKAKAMVESLELRIEIAAEGDLTADVRAGDPAGMMHLAAGESVVARGDGRLKIHLPGIAMLEISGPSGDAAQWRARRDESETLLGRLLEPFGVAAWEELADRVERRGTLYGELVAAKAEYAAAVGSDDLAELQARARELAAQRDGILVAEPAWKQEDPDLTALRTAADAVKAAWDRQQSETRAKWQAAEKRRADAEGAAACAAAARASNESALADAEREFAALESDGKTRAERQQELCGRRRECESAEAALAEIDAAIAPLPQDAPETAAAMLQKITAIEAEIQRAREGYKEDEAAAGAILRQGPYSSLAIAEERVRQLEADEAAESNRLEAIRRLRTVVDAAKAKVLAGISEPVEERATALLERIAGRPFGRIRLGDAMTLESLRPAGCSEDAALEQMSSGEREQIYFATRLALADVLGTPERQVVVLDDPLVDTDTDRLSRALELIKERSDRLQFVILTCHPERYLGMPNLVSHHFERSEAHAEVAS